MARYKKSKTRPPVSSSQKQQDKQFLLKVFQKRLKSPGTKSTLAAALTEYTGKTIVENKTVSTPVVWVTDSSADYERENQTPSKGMKRVRKVKRWKTKSERDKYRANWTKSSKNDKLILKTSREKSDFRQHVRMAHQAADIGPGTSVKIITQNRLTRRLGLFNQGKASGTIGRESLRVSESVQAQTELHIRDILGSTPIKPKTTKAALPGQQDSSFDKLTKECDTEQQSTAEQVIITRELTSTPIEVNTDPPKSACTPLEGLPEFPNIGCIAADLLSSLHQCTLLKKDMLQKAKDELRMLLSQSNSESQVTPDCKSPTNQSYSYIALKRSLSSETVTRTQEECDTIPKDTDIKVSCRRECINPVSNRPASILMGHGSRDDNIEPSRLLSEVENQTWFFRDDLPYNDLPFERSSQQSLIDLKVHALSDARALITLNDMTSSQDTDADFGQSRLTGSPNVSRHNVDNIRTADHHKMSDSLHHLKDSKHAVAEMLYPPAHISSRACHVCDLHDNIGDNFHTLYEASQMTEEMDDFEAFNVEIQPHSSSHHNATLLRCPPNNILYPEPKHMFLKLASPESDGSPVWYPSTIQLPPKPSLSPSPPLKLYRRRLY